MTSSTPRGLTTVALLKARFDEGVDLLDMFMPLVIDSIANIPSNNFTVADVKQTILSRHGITLPQDTLTTLLKRAVRQRFIKRSAGIYLNLHKAKPNNVQSLKISIEAEQKHLAEELVKFAAENKYPIESNDKALILILNFLEENKVAILLGSNQIEQQQTLLTNKEARIVAEFAEKIILNKSDLTRILNNILEGLVVYNTASLADITSPTRQLKGLRVYLDTQFLFQALGHEGESQKILATETLQLFKNIGIQCLVFDKTIKEMQGILHFIEKNIGSHSNIKYISSNPMARLFLNNRNTPSDVRQLSALVPEALNSIGIQNVQMPTHIPKYTLDEKKLGEILVDKDKGNIEEPRIIHDVDCAAAILTLRAGMNYTSITNTKFVFATSSYQVVKMFRSGLKMKEKMV